MQQCGCLVLSALNSKAQPAPSHLQLMDSQLESWMGLFRYYIAMPDNPALAEKDRDKVHDPLGPTGLPQEHRFSECIASLLL